MPQYKESKSVHNVDNDNFRRPDWLVFARGFKTSLRRWKLWGITWVVLLLLSFVPALMTAETYGALVGHRYPSANVAQDLAATLISPAQGLDVTFRVDHAQSLRQLDRNLSAAGAGLAFVAFLFGIFAAGGWLQVIFEQPNRGQLRRFGFGGARYFGRFLRLAIAVLLMLSLVRWFYYGDPWKRIVFGWMMDVPKHDWSALETLESERQVAQLTWIRDGLAALGFAKVLVWAIYTRTRLALRDGSSVIAAGIASTFLMVRHPIQTLRPLLFLLLVEVAFVVVFLGWVQGGLEIRLAAGASCLLYTSPSPRDQRGSRMPSSA